MSTSPHKTSDSTYRMDPELKAKWVAALRSAEYPQGSQQYFDGNGYCCLGVLGCVITGVRGRDLYQQDCVDRGIAGIRDDIFDCLVHMNDTEHKTFLEIADYIEANL